MAQAPYDGGAPTVAPETRAPDDYQRIDAKPEQFGGLIAKGAQQLGAGTEKAAESAFDISKFWGEVQTDGAINNSLTDVNNTIAHFRSLRGQQALDAQDATQKQIDQTFKQGREALTSPAQQRQYDETVRNYQQRYISGLLTTHADTEAKAHIAKTNQDSFGLAISGVANTAEDPQSVVNFREDARRAAIKQVYADGNGGDPTILKAALARADQAVFKTQVEAIGVKDPKAATAIAEQRRAELGDQYDNVMNSLRARKQQQGGIEAGAEAFTQAQHGVAPGGGPSVQQVHAAIIGQESGGNPNIRASIDGAHGIGQIMPATFAQWARPGERIDNPADNLAVSQRIIQSYYDRYHGDPARVAVAYFSGPGNVAPEGSPTPWIRDSRDGNGKSVASYAQDIQRRVGGAPRQGGNLEAADAQMQLTPQEKFLYQMHLSNLNGPGGVDNPDGSRSSLYQAVQEHDGKFYNIPTVWNGKIETEKWKRPSDGKVFDVPNATAIQNVERTGWNKFPSYNSPEEADERYDKMHGFMEKDTGEFFSRRKSGAATTMVNQGTGAAAPAYAARKADAYQIIADRTDLDHEEKVHAYQYVNQTINAQEIAENQNARARKEAVDRAAGGYFTEIIDAKHSPNPDYVALAGRINHDPVFADDIHTRAALLDRITKLSGEEEALGFGPGYLAARNGLFSAPDTPGHINDMTSLAQRPDITMAGLSDLNKRWTLAKRSVDHAATERQVNFFLQDAKSKLSFEQDVGYLKIRDPKGEHIFNAEFAPKFVKRISELADEAERTGDHKKLDDFLTSENVSKMIRSFRDPRQMAAERLSAIGEAAGDSGGNNNEPLPPTPEGLNPAAWVPLVRSPPRTASGKLWPLTNWAENLEHLHNNPTPEVKEVFDRRFGKALGMTADQVIAKLGAPTGATETLAAPAATPAAARPNESIMTQNRREMEELNKHRLVPATYPPNAKPTLQ